MPYALIIIGIVLAVAGARNTQGELFDLLKGDFTGDRSFVWWMISILLIGSIGYVSDLKKLSNAFLLLVMIVLLISTTKNGSSVLGQFVDAVKAPIPRQEAQATRNKSDNVSGGSGGSGGSDFLGTAISIGSKFFGF